MRYIVLAIPAWIPEQEAQEFAAMINDTFQPHYPPRILSSKNGKIDTLQVSSYEPGRAV